MKSENEKLVTKVQYLEQEIEKLQKSLESAKSFIDINATKAPVRLYIIGKYNEFDEEKALLNISIEGKKYYYPLSSYASSRLPFPDSRVLIFNEECTQNKAYILAFEQGRLIAPAPTYLSSVISVKFLKEEITVKMEFYGNITLKLNKDFLKHNKPYLGQIILIKKIHIATDIFFIPLESNSKVELQNERIYTLLAKLNT